MVGGKMVLVSIALYIASIFTFVIMKAWKKSVFKILSYLSLVSVLIVFYIYWMKTGGFSTFQENIIFGGSYFVDLAKNAYIETNDLAFVLSVSRLLYPLFILYDALMDNYKYKNIFKKRKWLYVVVALPIIALIGISIPELFFELFGHHYILQSFIVKMINLVIILYLVMALFLYIHENTVIMLSWYRRQQKFMLFSQIAIILQFLYYIGFEPVTIFQDYNKVYYISSFFTYFNTQLMSVWVAVFTICISVTVFSMVLLVRYSNFEFDRMKQELVISKAISQATLSTTAIVHGIKNQILASKILTENVIDAVQLENKAVANKNLEKLLRVNDIMSSRMDYLYKSFKNMKTVLAKVKVSTVIGNLITKIQNTIPNENFEIDIADDYILADIDLLSEALYNFVINAYEAVPLERQPEIKIKSTIARNHYVFEISDNGNGIPKEFQNNLFQPFVSGKNSDNNWGLGLCNARKIIVNHLGYVKFETKDKVGTSFFIVLPNYQKKRGEI